MRRYGRIFIIVPNGRQVYGWMPGLSGGTLPEHRLRDRLAAQTHGATEASLGYGRADVLTAQTVFEVEHRAKWRTAVRQAMQYAYQTGCTPAVALFGDMTRKGMLDLYLRLRDGKPPIELWWWYSDIDRWHRINSRGAVRGAAS